MEDHGIKPGAEWKANILFNVDGGLQQRGGYDDEFKFRLTIDLAKLTGWEAIEGLTLDVRYRGGAGVNKFTGTSSQFVPSTFQGGRLWRFQNAYATYTTPGTLGVKEFLTISGGWQNPTDIFVTPKINFLSTTRLLPTVALVPMVSAGVRELFSLGRIRKDQAHRLVLCSKWPLYGYSRRREHIESRA